MDKGRSRYVMAGHTRTHWTEVGESGPPIVLVHGGGIGISGAFYFESILDALGARYWTIALDSVGGYGDTDPRAPVDEGVQSRVDHLVDFLDALCLDDVYMMGNSQGAWVAAKYAHDHPERVRKLALLASGTISTAMGLDSVSTRESLDGTAEAMRRRLRPLIHNQARITTDMIERSLEIAARPGVAEAQAAFARGMKRLRDDPRLRFKYEMQDWLPRLPIPTIFLWGEKDESALPAWGHTLEDMLPNTPFHWVPDAGHRMWVDQPELVAGHLLDFFASP